jgi:site-specific recombinase XerD
MNMIVRQHLLDLKAKSNRSDLVFSNSDGSNFDVNHLYRDFRNFTKKAKVPTQYRFHDIRHTFASHFMMNGGNIYDLQKILGHTSLDMTQRYAHLAPEHLVLAANIVRFGEKHLENKNENKNNEKPKRHLAIV